MTTAELELTEEIREKARPTKNTTPPLKLTKPAALEAGLAKVSDALRPLQTWLVQALSSQKALLAPLGEDPVTKLHALMVVPPPGHHPAMLAVAVTQAHGFGPVLQALIAPCQLVVKRVMEDRTEHLWLTPAAPDAQAKPAGSVIPHDHSRWLPPLRRFFDAASDDDRATWHALVQQQRAALPLKLRAALSRLFRETAWAEEDAAALLATTPLPATASGVWEDLLGALLPYVERDDLFEALASHARFVMPPGPLYAEIVVRPPAARAVKRILRLLQKPLAAPGTPHVVAIVSALACSRDETAAAAIASAALLAKAEAKAYFLANPQHMPLLEAHAQGRGKEPAAVRALVTEIERQRLAANAPPHAGDLPAVLAAPPWLARQAPWPARALELIIDGERVVETYSLMTARKQLGQPSPTPEAEILAKKGVIDTAEFAALSDEAALANIHRLKAFDLSAAVARFGVAAIPALAKLMAEKPLSSHTDVLAQLRSPRLAPVAWYMYRNDAWLLDDPGVSALGLIPRLFAEAPGIRYLAELGLLRLCVAGHRADVSRSAARYGEEVARAVDEVLDRDPAQRLPDPLPHLDKRLEDGSLPVLATKDGPLPPSTIPTVGMLLAVSPMWLPHPGLAELRQVCTEASRDAFAWEVYEKTSDLTAAAHLGGDGVIRKLDALLSAKRETLKPVVRFRMFEALGHAGSPLALVLLKKHALLSPWSDRTGHIETIFDRLARARGVTRAQLDDDAFGALGVARELPVLDYGPRSFRVTLDDHLVPRITDEAGNPIPKLPKPTKKDDAAKAAHAKAQLDALTLDLDDVREMLLTFFERAMATGRTFEASRFESAIVAHPLLVQIARRLVFASGEKFFRVAEDGSLADAEDRELGLAADAAVRVAHPVELSGEELARFRQLFADYEIIQPFLQLERPMFHLTDEERASSTIARFTGRRVTPSARAKLLGGPGWGHWGNGMRKVHGPRAVEAQFTPRPGQGTLPATEELTGCELREGKAPVLFSTLTAVEASELLRDLTSLPWV